ncbi:MAG: ATP-binding protein [Bacteroidota bacterium]
MNRKEENNILQALLDSSPDNAKIKQTVRQAYDTMDIFIALVKPGGKIIYLNRKAKDLLNCTDDEHSSINIISDFILRGKKSETQNFLRQLVKRKEEGEEEYTYHFSNEYFRDLAIKAINRVILNSEKKTKAIFITGIKLSPKTHSESEDKKTLAESLDRSKDALKAKNDFLANVSHEIRTPLTAILGFTEQLMQTDLDEKQEKYLNIIDKSAEHMLGLINDILVYSKVEARKIRFDNAPFKIEETVKNVFITLQERAKDRGLDFKYDIDKNLDIVLIGDSFRLRQILINMLSNAIKFTNKGSVQLKVLMQEETEDSCYAMFRVIDTGIGISRKNLKSIFNQYRQADPSDSLKHGGTGLGLTICKNLIELQGGTLSVKSQPGKGSEFSFVIPYKKGHPDNITKIDSAEKDVNKLKDKKVLLVDDDSVNRLLGKTLLEKFKCRADIVSGGKKAKSLLDIKNFDIILLDIQMPDVDGYQVANYLRKSKKDKTTKIIAFTAVTRINDIKDFQQTGIDDFIIKPYREINLFNKMCEVLGIEYNEEEEPISEIILREEISPKPYDLSELASMAEGNKVIINNAIKNFVSNSEVTIYLFKKYLEEKNLKKIGNAAHKLIPSYAHLRVNTVLPSLKEIDLKTKNNPEPEYQSINKLVNNTIKEMEKVVRVIKTDFNI